MKQRAIEGWPIHWYNAESYIPCPARDCTKIFDSAHVRYMGDHWRDQDPGSPSYNDHGILLAIRRQTDCVYCDYHNDLSLKELLAHEQDVHGSSNMSTIDGYLRLMRRGLDTDEARVCRDQAYKRLIGNIWASEYRHRILSRVFPEVLPHEASMRRDLAPILSYQNKLAQRPDCAVILAQHFLTHLRPKPDDRSTWPATYHELRGLYASGIV